MKFRRIISGNLPLCAFVSTIKVKSDNGYITNMIGWINECIEYSKCWYATPSACKQLKSRVLICIEEINECITKGWLDGVIAHESLYELETLSKILDTGINNSNYN